MTRRGHPMALRVATWNLHACVGRNGRFDPERIAAVLAGIGADLLALQEIDSRAGTAGSCDVFEFLIRHFGPEAAIARTLCAADGDYGHMILSRWPLTQRAIHEISVVDREPRLAIEFEMASPLGSLWGLATHLGLRRSERARQFEVLKRVTLAAPPGAGLILGDFNEPRRRRIAATFGADFTPTPLRPTFPARWPLFALDFIWYRAPLRLRRCWAAADGRLASDHLPLVAEFEIAEAGLSGRQ